MTNPDQFARTTLSVTEHARAKVKAMQMWWRAHKGYKPNQSEMVIKGMEALQREQQAGQSMGGGAEVTRWAETEELADEP